MKKAIVNPDDLGPKQRDRVEWSQYEQEGPGDCPAHYHGPGMWTAARLLRTPSQHRLARDLMKAGRRMAQWDFGLAP